MRIRTELPGSIRRMPALVNVFADARRILLDGKRPDAVTVPRMPTMLKHSFEKNRVQARGTELSSEIREGK